MKRSQGPSEQLGSPSIASCFKLPFEVVERTRLGVKYLFCEKLKIYFYEGLIYESLSDIITVNVNTRIEPIDYVARRVHSFDQGGIGERCARMFERYGALTRGEVGELNFNVITFEITKASFKILHTRSSAMTCNYVIHVCIPFKRHDEDVDEFNLALEDTYLDIMGFAEELAKFYRDDRPYQTVGIQLVQSRFGEEWKNLCKSVLDAIGIFSNEVENPLIQNINIAVAKHENYLVENYKQRLFSDFDNFVYKANLKELKSKLMSMDELLSDELPYIEFELIDESRFYYKYSEINLAIQIDQNGDLWTDSFDAIFRPARPALTFYNITTDIKLKEASKNGLPDECYQYIIHNDRLRHGMVIHTESHMANTKYVVHGIVPNRTESEDKAAFFNIADGMFHSAFECADKQMNAGTFGVSMESLDDFGVLHEDSALSLVNAIEQFVNQRDNGAEQGALRCIKIIKSGPFHPVFDHLKRYIQARMLRVKRSRVKI